MDVRSWRLKRALEYALSLKCLSGRAWEVILGHFSFLGLQERGTVSTVFTIYSLRPKELLQLLALMEQVTRGAFLFF